MMRTLSLSLMLLSGCSLIDGLSGGQETSGQFQGAFLVGQGLNQVTQFDWDGDGFPNLIGTGTNMTGSTGQVFANPITREGTAIATFSMAAITSTPIMEIAAGNFLGGATPLLALLRTDGVNFVDESSQVLTCSVSNTVAIVAGNFLAGNGSTDLLLLTRNPSQFRIYTAGPNVCADADAGAVNLGGEPLAATAADFDGDGADDAVIALGGAPMQIVRGGATVTVGQFSEVSMNETLSHLAAGRLNEDAAPDVAASVVSANGSGNYITFFTNNGSGTGNQGGMLIPSTVVSDVVIAHRGSGELSSIIAGQVPMQPEGVLVLEGFGNLGFDAKAVSGGWGGQPRSLVAADFNGDGKDDVAGPVDPANQIGVMLSR